MQHDHGLDPRLTVDDRNRRDAALADAFQRQRQLRCRRLQRCQAGQGLQPAAGPAALQHRQQHGITAERVQRLRESVVAGGLRLEQKAPMRVLRIDCAEADERPGPQHVQRRVQRLGPALHAVQGAGELLQLLLQVELQSLRGLGLQRQLDFQAPVDGAQQQLALAQAPGNALAKIGQRFLVPADRGHQSACGNSEHRVQMTQMGGLPGVSRLVESGVEQAQQVALLLAVQVPQRVGVKQPQQPCARCVGVEVAIEGLDQMRAAPAQEATRPAQQLGAEFAIRIEIGGDVAQQPLRAVEQRGLGKPEQRGDLCGVGRIECATKRCGDLHALAIGQVERRAQRAQDLGHARFDHVELDRVEGQREGIGAHACEQWLAGQPGEPRSELLQQAIGDVATPALVEGAELVQVEHHDGQLAAVRQLRATTCQRGLERFAAQQVGECVALRIVGRRGGGRGWHVGVRAPEHAPSDDDAAEQRGVQRQPPRRSAQPAREPRVERDQNERDQRGVRRPPARRCGIRRRGR